MTWFICCGTTMEFFFISLRRSKDWRSTVTSLTINFSISSLISPSPPCSSFFYHHFFPEWCFQLFSNHSTTSRAFKLWGSQSHILVDFLVVLLSDWWSIFGWLMIKSAGLTSPSDRAIHPTDTPPQPHTGRLNNLCTILNMKEDLTLQSPPAPFPFSLDRWDGQTASNCDCLQRNSVYVWIQSLKSILSESGSCGYFQIPWIEKCRGNWVIGNPNPSKNGQGALRRVIWGLVICLENFCFETHVA